MIGPFHMVSIFARIIAIFHVPMLSKSSKFVVCVFIQFHSEFSATTWMHHNFQKLCFNLVQSSRSLVFGKVAGWSCRQPTAVCAKWVDETVVSGSCVGCFFRLCDFVCNFIFVPGCVVISVNFHGCCLRCVSDNCVSSREW